MKAEPPRNPARANARALELSDRDSNLETGGGNRDVDWYLFTGLDLRKLNHPRPDILGPGLVEVFSVKEGPDLDVDIVAVRDR